MLLLLLLSAVLLLLSLLVPLECVLLGLLLRLRTLEVDFIPLLLPLPVLQPEDPLIIGKRAHGHKEREKEARSLTEMPEPRMCASHYLSLAGNSSAFPRIQTYYLLKNSHEMKLTP